MVKGSEIQPPVNEHLWDVDIDFSMDYYLVVAANGVVVRDNVEMDSQILGLLYQSKYYLGRKKTITTILHLLLRKF